VVFASCKVTKTTNNNGHAQSSKPEESRLGKCMFV